MLDLLDVMPRNELPNESSIARLKLVQENQILEDGDIRPDQVILQVLSNDKIRLVWEGFYEILTTSISSKEAEYFLNNLLKSDSHSTSDPAILKNVLMYVPTDLRKIIQPTEAAMPESPYSTQQKVISGIVFCLFIVHAPENFFDIAILAGMFLSVLLVKKVFNFVYPEPAREVKLDKWHKKEEERLAYELFQKERINDFNQLFVVKALASIMTVGDERYTGVPVGLCFYLFSYFLAPIIFLIESLQKSEVSDSLKNVLGFFLCEYLKKIVIQPSDAFIAIREKNQNTIAGFVVDRIYWKNGFLQAIGCGGENKMAETKNTVTSSR